MCKVDAVVDVDVVELFYKFVFRQTGHKVNHILRERGTIKVVCIMQNCFILRREGSFCLSQGSTSDEIAFTMSNNSDKLMKKTENKTPKNIVE